MHKGYLLGIDIGTTSSKGVLIDFQGKIIAFASLEHRVDRPCAQWAEHNAEKVWWRDFISICKSILKRSGLAPERIVAVACSSLFPNLLPVGTDGEPLRPALLYSDGRAASEVAQLTETLGEERIIKIAGRKLSNQSVAPKILWLQRNEPEVFTRTAKYITTSSYLVYKLTGVYTIDHFSACAGGIPYNINRQAWDEEVFQAIGISRCQLPGLYWANQLAGYVTEEAASLTGLARGTPVAVGTGDSAAEALSIGACRPHQAVITYGTTVCLVNCTDRFKFHKHISCAPFCLPGLYMIGAGLTTGGALTRWFCDNFARQEMDLGTQNGETAYARLSTEAARIPPGSRGIVVLPYFNGERSPFYDPKARGLIIGLTLRHTRGHLYRAFLEGVAYGVRHILDAGKDLYLSIKDFYAVGGGTRSKLWPQIISDVIQKEQKIMEPTVGSPLGAALLGGMAIGGIERVEDMEHRPAVERVVNPDQANALVYDNYYQVYRSLYESTWDHMHALVDLENLK